MVVTVSVTVSNVGALLKFTFGKFAKHLLINQSFELPLQTHSSFETPNNVRIITAVLSTFMFT